MAIISIKELSEELGISRQAVYKRIHQLPSQYQPKKIDGVYKLTPKTVDLIRNFEDVSTKLPTNDNQLVGIMKTQINELKEDKERLYEQLFQKDKQLDHLQKLLDQQQQLTLQSNQRIQQLQYEFTKPIEDSKQTESSPIPPEQMESSEPKVKKGFFKRLFEK